MFDIKNIIILIVALCNFFLGSYVLFYDRKKTLNRVFAYMSFSVVVWCLTMIMFRMIGTVEKSIVWAMFLYASAAFIAYTFLLFTFIFPEGKDVSKGIYKILIFLPFLLIVLSCIMPGWVIKNVDIGIGQEKTIIFGQIYWIYALYIPIYFSWGFFNLIKKYLKATGLHRLQIKYVFIGSFTSAFLGMVTNLTLPSIGIFSFNWLGQILTLFFIGCVAYAITRYRLMDIRIVVRRSTIYLLLAGFAYGAFYFFVWLFNTLFGSVYAPSAFLLGIALAFVFVFCFFGFEKGVRKIANQYFFTGLYSQQEALRKLSREIATLIDLDKLMDTVCQVIKPALGLDKIAVVLREENNQERYVIEKTIGFRRNNGLSLLRHNVLTKTLQQTGKPIVYEEAGAKELKALRKDMKRIQAQLCLPLIIQHKLQGIIVLGKKLSGNPYTKEDLELLEVIANQTAIALENARLYDRVRDLSANLQDKVDQQTKKLRQTLAELQQLNDTKTEFISMASHQLRTPLTIVKGYVSMLLEGDFGGLPQKMKKPLQNVFDASMRLVKIVRDLLDVSQIELGKMTLKTEPTDIPALLKESCEEMQKPAQDKGLALSFHEPSQSLPKVPIDRSKVYQVVLNLIDNAVRYTDKGRIDVSVGKQDKSIIIKVKDTGQGLSEQDKKELFEGFVRGSAGRKEFIEGTGLGLYVAKKYITSHHGRLWAESKGKGRGSIFYIELPLSP